MEGSYFPEDKDLAHKIMMDLSNSDLIRICATNKRMHDVCNNYPSFWRDKFIKDYGEHAAQYKPAKRGWKNHYMKVFIHLQRFEKNPLQFLRKIAWKDDVEHSFFIKKKKKKLVPLKDTPDWVMENLYLLNIENVKVDISDRHSSGFKEYKNIKPIELLQQIPRNILTKKLYQQGFFLKNGNLRPQFGTLDSIEEWNFD